MIWATNKSKSIPVSDEFVCEYTCVYVCVCVARFYFLSPRRMNLNEFYSLCVYMIKLIVSGIIEILNRSFEYDVVLIESEQLCILICIHQLDQKC